LKKYLQLAALIFKNGTLRNSGQNFNENRAKSLENLQEFVPPHVVEYLQVRKPNPSTKSLVKSLIRQAAFIKYAFRNDGAHLNSQNLSYIRIPKAANTSISYAMLSKKYPDLQEKNPDEYQINFLADVNLLPAMKVKTETIFTVVRNPFARLVSVYRDFFETNHTPFIYSTYLFGILKQEISFAEFVSRINRIPDRLKDQHFRPQHCFFKPYENRGFAIESIKLEETPDLENFLKKHGMELTHRNKSREAYDYTQYYDPHLLQEVYEIYEADIKKFGYQQTYLELKQHFQG
jgi:hypothetical protein